mmetsp:Transcript_87683/g.165344  ORF Transcript_87683/g.165344 Transcript_87683/m.165344 type:complete len:242 (-) Transcript_87683:74-799(-)
MPAGQGMTLDEANSQTAAMKESILAAATAKAEEVKEQGMNEFNIEKAKIISADKAKIQAEYAKKTKIIETKCAIARSMAINNARLEKVKTRQEVLGKLAMDASAKLADELKKEAETKKFYVKLIVQGLIMLLEEEVIVKCREADAKMVEGCLKESQDEYTKVIKTQTGADKKCTISLDKTYLAPAPVPGSDAASCLGGVVLLCQGGSIKIDNTIDARLGLVLEQDKPTIRKLLFPVPEQKS